MQAFFEKKFVDNSSSAKKVLKKANFRGQEPLFFRFRKRPTLPELPCLALLCCKPTADIRKPRFTGFDRKPGRGTN